MNLFNKLMFFLLFFLAEHSKKNILALLLNYNFLGPWSNNLCCVLKRVFEPLKFLEQKYTLGNSQHTNSYSLALTPNPSLVAIPLQQVRHKGDVDDGKAQRVDP